LALEQSIRTGGLDEEAGCDIPDAMVEPDLDRAAGKRPSQRFPAFEILA